MSTPTTEIDPFTAGLQAVEQLILKKDLQQAAEKLNVLGRSAPQHPLVYTLGARLGEAAGNAPAALKSARRAVEVAPGWSFTVIELAMLLARQGQAPEAVQEARKGVELSPGDLNVLTRAIDIAHHANDSAAALPWLRTAVAMQPDSLVFRRHLARDLAQLGHTAEALPLFDSLVEVQAEDSPLLSERMATAFACGDTARAQADADVLVAREPGNAQYLFWQQRSRGEVPGTQPGEMVAELFDNYAPSFDIHLVRGLKYDTPRHVAALIRDIYPTLELNVLDLGCGTGLLGVYLGRINGFLIGVDVSEKMLEQAARHNVYDRFHQVNLLDALDATPATLYQVITACDVFVYVGDLSKAIPDAFRVLVADGRLIFSCERADDEGPDMVLRDTARYAHRAGAIESMCRAAGFDAVKIEYADLRMEGGEPVRGFYVTAHKPA